MSKVMGVQLGSHSAFDEDADHCASSPDTEYAAALKAFEARAGRLIVSREYDEMRLENLRAAGL